MSATGLKLLESELQVRLPKNYFDAWRLVQKNCPDVDDQQGPSLDTNVETLVEVNKQIRRKPSDFIRSPKELSKTWPNELIVCYSNDRLLCFFDSTKEDPDIQFAISKVVQAKDPSRAPSLYSSLTELAKYSIWKFRNNETFHNRRLKEERERAKARANKTESSKLLECPDLITEGWKLARPTLILKDSGKTYAAVVEGDGVVKPTRPGKWKHLFSFLCNKIPENAENLGGVISVYEQDDYLDGLAAFHDPEAVLPRKTNGIKVHGLKQQLCLPSLGVVLTKGSSTVRSWVKSVGEWVGDLECFEDNTRVADYMSEFGANHPHFDLDCRLMLGGWGAVYPESDWMTRMKHTLLASKPSREPWIDVYRVGKKFEVDRQGS
ncbi:MAG: hypothetical protein U0930_01480 [Pirellulales bacterium]